MKTIAVTEENYENEVLKSDRPVLLDFWAAWCGPCKMLAPILDEIAGEQPDIKICKVNSDEQPMLAQKFHVMAVPSLVFIKNGNVINKSVGMRPKAAIMEMINS